MSRKELVKAVALKADIPQTVADRVLTVLIEEFKTSLAAGEEVSIKGFGTFSITYHKARTGRHPGTGEPLAIAASNRVKFKQHKALKELVQ